MRIAFIGQKGIPTKFGGIERHVEELVVRLAKSGHGVFVYCRPWYTPKELKKYSGVNLINLPSIKTKHLDAISHTLAATIHALLADYDVIHYHGVGPSLLSFIPRLFKPGVRVVVTFHCIDRKHQKWGLFARLALGLGEWAACRFAHQTIVVSKTLQYYCSQVYNTDTIYIPHGVAQRQSNYGDDLIKKNFGLVKDSYLVVVSRLVGHKGIHYLIEAYKKLKTNKKLVIVGGSAFTDDYVTKLKDLAYGNKNIIFTGYQSGKVLDQLFANAYLAAHPSEFEGLPLTVLEAMSYGKTILASDIAENSELVKGHGFSFKNRNVSDLTKKLNQLLAEPKLVARVGEASRRHVVKNYNWDEVTKKTLAVYREVLGDKKVKTVLATEKV